MTTSPESRDHDDLEALLAAAMRSEADQVVPAGDGLARIRARTARRPGVLAWLTRPAAAGGILVVALVTATLAGMQLADDGRGERITVEPKPDPIATTMFAPATIPNDMADNAHYNPDPGPDSGASGGEAPEATAELTRPRPTPRESRSCRRSRSSARVTAASRSTTAGTTSRSPRRCRDAATAVPSPSPGRPGCSRRT